MGKHILEGAFPWLYYGDSYCGILEPILAAWSFLFFGVRRLSLHLIPLLFSILFLISIYQLGREIFNREIALLGLLLAALPFFSMGYYSSLAYGGYVEILWLGNLILLISHRLATGQEKISLSVLFFLGALWGIAWWTYPISAVYLAVSGFFLLIFRIDSFLKGKILATVPGFFLGSLPFWIWNGANRFPFLTFSSSQENPNYIYRIERFFREFIEFFNPGMQQHFTPIAIFLAAAFLGSLLLLLITWKKVGRQFPSGRGPALLLLFFLFFLLFYIGSRFSEQNASRYLLPLYSILPFSFAFMVYAVKARSPGLYWVILLLLFSVQTYHQFFLERHLKGDSAAYQKKLEVEHDLFHFLRQKNHSYVYVPEYWSAAELTFNALENPAFCLPFKDRYPLYTLKADAVTDPAFVLDGKYPGSFEQMFRALGGTYSKKIISIYPGVKGYVVYYDFQPPVLRSREIPPLGWKAKSSHNADAETRAFDRTRSSFWSTSLPQKPGMFYQIDFNQQYFLNRLVILAGKGKEGDFPAYYKVEISKDQRNWNQITSVNNNWAYLFWSGGRPFWKLRDGRLEINFSAQEGRYLRITLTAAAPQPWSIAEIFAYQAVKGGETTTFDFSELVSFLSKENIKYIYADIGLSARLTEFSRGAIKCLQDDYDITSGEDYSRWGYNGAFPYFNKLKKQVDFSLSPAFVVAEENSPSFTRTMDRLNLSYSFKIFGDQIVYYGFKAFGAGMKIGNRQGLEAFYWTGTHLLDNKWLSSGNQ